MAGRTPLPSHVGAAALTVLSGALAAALALTSAPAAVPAAVPAAPAPAPAAALRVVAAYQAAPAPVVLSFPAPPPPAPAPAAPARVADPLCSGEGWQERRVAAAVDRLRRPADAAAVDVRVRPARADVLGMAQLGAGRVELFVRSCARQSDALVLHVLAHELGHLVDATRMDDGLRAQWKAARGIPAATPWFGCDGCTDFATPAGDFAEVYAQWQRGASGNRSELAGDVPPAELARLAAAFFRPL